jgi:hypothetical protein
MQRKDLPSALMLLLSVVQYLTEVDPWGNTLIARFVRATPEMSPRLQPEVPISPRLSNTTLDRNLFRTCVTSRLACFPIPNLEESALSFRSSCFSRPCQRNPLQT